MKNKVKNFLRSKYGKLCLCVCMISSMLAVSCCAAEEAVGGIDATAITAAFTNGFTGIVTNSVAMLSAMLPIAISLCGVLFVIKKGMKWFNSVAKG